MNVFSLFAKIGLDTKDYESGLKESKSKFHDFADGLKGAAGKIGDVLAGIGKTAAVGIGAASTAVTALTKQSLDAVADFEQLKGGVDTLFGDAAKKVMNYANEAYAEAGLSANEYMEQTIAFSASLIQGLEGDTDKAADIANTAITDMADNVNKMGTTMEAVQNTYRGLARQNFTMLDNLAIGYQGTADEMARLINDSKVMGDTFVATADNVKEISFDKYIEAIHTIQTEMGITGTTHEEAAKTITGSVASMKAAWKNFLTGTGSAEQFTSVLKNTVTNIKTNLSTIIPRLTTGLTELVDMISPEIPALIEELLPPVIDGASTLLTGLADRLPQLIETILPALSEGVINVSVALVRVMPQLITSLKNSIPIVVNTIMEKKNDLLKAGKDMLSALFPSDMSNVPQIMASAVSTVTTFIADVTDPKNLKKVTDKAFEIIDALIEGLTSDATLDALLDPNTGVIKIIENIGTGLVEFSFHLVSSATTIIKNLGDYLNNEDNRRQLFETAKQILIKIGKGLVSMEAREAVAGLIIEAAKFLADTFIGGIDWEATGGEIAWQIIKGIYNNLLPVKAMDWAAGNLESVLNWREHEYLDSGTPLSYDDYWKTRRDANVSNYTSTTIPHNIAEEYALRYGAPSVSEAPTLGGNNISITVNATSNEPDEIGYAVSDAVDQSLAKLQAQKNRGYGYSH